MPAENNIFSRMVCLFGRLLYAQDFHARRKVSKKSLKSSTVKHPSASTSTTSDGRRLIVTHLQLPSITSTATQASKEKEEKQEEEEAASSSSKLGSDGTSLSGGRAAVLPPSRPDIASRVTSRSRNSYAGRSSRPSARTSGMNNIGSRPTSSSRNSPFRKSSTRPKTPVVARGAALEERRTSSNLDSTGPPSYMDVIHAIEGTSQHNRDAPPTYETLFQRKSPALGSSIGQSD